MLLQAAQLFEQDMPPVQVAHQFRVSTKSAYQWRRCWRVGGATALASKGAGGGGVPAVGGAAGPAARRGWSSWIRLLASGGLSRGLGPRLSVDKSMQLCLGLLWELPEGPPMLRRVSPL